MSARALGILDVPVERLATSLAPLRGPRTDVGGSLAPLPLRVAATGDGTYEVLDGFKRLARWCQDGHTHVPVIVEDTADSAVVCKARLLEANTPRRTLSPMDEVRLVRSLTDDDHLSPTQIAKVLNRGRAWVDRRLTLGRRFSAELAPHLDDGRLSVTVAHVIATCPRGEQKRVTESIVRHGLRSREAEAFLSAWRIATDAVTREALLRDPRRATPQPGEPSVSSLGPTARELQARFAHTERALDELTLELDLSGFSEAEQRVLQACQRRLAAHIHQLAHQLHPDTTQENTPHADPRGTERASEALPRAPTHPRHRAAAESRPQNHPSRPAGRAGLTDPSGARSLGAPVERGDRGDGTVLQARALPRADQGPVCPGTSLSPDSPRDPGARVRGQHDHPQGFPADRAATQAGEAHRLPPLRNPDRAGGAVRLEPLPGDDRRAVDHRARL